MQTSSSITGITPPSEPPITTSIPTDSPVINGSVVVPKEIKSVPTLYVRNLNEKIKVEGKQVYNTQMMM